MNKKGFFSQLVLSLLLGLVVSINSFATSTDYQEPGVMVNLLFDEMNAQILFDKDKIEADKGHLLALGHRVLSPYVSFDKMAKQVLGKHWRKITKDQQQRFIEAFKARVSVAMATQYDPNKKYTLDVIGERRNKKGDRALVKSKVREIGGASNYAISYKFYLGKKTKVWRVYDVIVEGISILQSFKSASAEEIKKNGIEKLIEQLAVTPAEVEDAEDDVDDEVNGDAVEIDSAVVAVVKEDG
ncbi:MAG: hypothetical protein COA99_06350 [Moraxellaceae bacterium]|nr:MAG: hypothetical protein COA99_06350 [Moraxellaceae bacterium]